MGIARKIFALAAFCASAVPGLAQMTREEFNSFAQKIAQQSRTGASSTPEIDAIEAARREGDAETGLKLSEAAVAAPAIPDESPGFNAWIKSKAYLYRGLATYDLTRDAARAVADIEKSAGLGNLQALHLLLDNFLKTPQESVFRGYQPGEDEVRRYFLIAAEIVDPTAVERLAAGKVSGVADKDAQTYWKMLAQTTPSERTNQIRELMKLKAEMGTENLNSIVAKYGLVGAPFEPRNESVPGRDLMATLYADHNLRYMLGRSLGSRSPRTGVDESQAITVMQHFLFLSTLTSRTGFADLYLLVPGKPASQEKNIRHLAREAVVAELEPGDNMWISCGALSHTATVFRVDPAADSLSLLDPHYEFWQPAINSCVKSFKHEPYKYGFYLLTLRLSEVVPMIDAIGTYRTAEPIGYSGYVPPALPHEEPATNAAGVAGQCAAEPRPAGRFVGGPSAELMKSDLMNLFNFVTFRTEPQKGGARLEIYKPGAAEMYGQVGLIAALDGKSCVYSLSLTVRRSFFEEVGTTMFARNIMASFLRQLKTPPTNEGSIVDVLAGKAPAYDSADSPDHLRIENITASNGAALLRITIW